MLSFVVFSGCDMTKPKNSQSPTETNKIKNSTKSAGSLHSEGLKLFNEGKYKEAIEVWLKESEIEPRNANTHNNIGIAYSFLGNYESAVLYHKKAIEINQNFGHAYYSLGRAYIRLGKNEEAKQVLSKAIELNYSPYDSYYLLGTVYKSLKEYDEAKDSLLKSLEFKKDSFTYYLLGDVYFDMKDYKQAKDAYNKALETNNEGFADDLEKLYSSIGLVNEKLGDTKAAESAYKKAKEIGRQRQKSKELDGTHAIFNKLIFKGQFIWYLIISVSGLIVFLVIIYVTKLYKFKGTKLKTRMNYALALSLFFTMLTLWQTGGEIQVIGKGFLLGCFLGVPLCFYYKKWTDSRIQGTKIFYKKGQRFRNLLWMIPLFILFQLFVHQDLGKKFLEAEWPMLGIVFSWFISQVFVLFYIIKIERKLGKPILEDEK
jgi:tetratricopeptide (TPR) repeat protein